MSNGQTPREVARLDDIRPRDPALTYEPFYRLAQKPFSLAADPQFLFKSDAHSPVFEDVLAGIRRREGLVVLTGDIGMGKTTLCRSAVQQLDRKTFSAFVPDPFMSREDLLKTLLIEFGVVSIDELRGGRLNSATRLELSYVLYEFLDSLVALQAFAVAIIDEAQNLSLPLLEEIRILSDLVGREKLLQVVLVGQLELESKFALPEMRQLDQRIAVRSRLAPLSAEDVKRYVRHRLAVASTAATTAAFAPDALEKICQISGGVPRAINLLCDRALYESYRLRAATVSSEAVVAAAERLGLPRVAAPPTPARTPVRTSTPQPVETSPPQPAGGLPEHTAALPDFLSENEIAVRRARSWTASAFLFLGAVIAISGALTWYFLMNASLGPAALAAPAPPSSPRRWQLALSSRPPVVQTPAFPAVRGGSAPSSPTYAIQIASFESADRASDLIELLAGAGIPAKQMERDLGPAGRWHQVFADGYTSIEHAEADLRRIHLMPAYSDARIMRLPAE